MPERPLHILYVGTLPPHPGGSAISGSQLIIGMAKAGHRVRALGPITVATAREAAAFDASYPEIEITRYQVDQYYTRVYQPAGARHQEVEGAAVRSHLSALLEQERPDVVFAGREMYASYIPDVVEPLRLPSVLRVAGGTLFGMISRQIPDKDAESLLHRFRTFDRVITPARYMEQLLNRLGVGNTLTVLNAVDLETFSPRPPDMALRRQLGLDDSDKVVLVIANLQPRKRPLDVVDSAARALAIDPSLVYVMIGAGASREDVERACADKGIAHRFRLEGWVSYDQVPRYLSIAAMLVHASEGEGLARAYLEAHASGVPIIASDIEAATELLRDGETALLYRVGDVEALARRTLELVAHPDVGTRIARNARARMADHSIHRAVAAYLTAFRRVRRADAR